MSIEESVPAALPEKPEAAKVRMLLPEALLKVKESFGALQLCVRRENLRDVLLILRDDPDLDYGYFSECVCVDYSRWGHERDLDGRFEVVYNLMSLKSYSRVFVKVSVDDGQRIESVKDIFLGAEYPEKEIGDLFGIHFEGNALMPGERFMLPDDWVGFPLRKEYPLGGDDVIFDGGSFGPAVEDVQMPHAGESFDGKTGSDEVSGR